MSKMVNITEEERERRRQNMLKLHDEGRAGGQYGKMGGRPRKPRASEYVAERVAQDAEDMYERMRQIVLEGSEKNAGAVWKELMKIEEQERKITVEEEDRIDQLNRDKLLELVQAQFSELAAAGTLTGIINVGEAEVIRDEGPTELGEITGGTEETDSTEGSAD
jgi:hypothetical protein